MLNSKSLNLEPTSRPMRQELNEALCDVKKLNLSLICRDGGMT
jgi:hypothetical protein